MIDINVRLSGAEIGDALLSEPEELFYALAQMAVDESDQEMRAIAHDVAQYAHGDRAEEVVRFLRILADRIEEEV